jgi:hypothetical protein
MQKVEGDTRPTPKPQCKSAIFKALYSLMLRCAADDHENHLLDFGVCATCVSTFQHIPHVFRPNRPSPLSHPSTYAQMRILKALSVLRLVNWPSSTTDGFARLCLTYNRKWRIIEFGWAANVMGCGREG